MSETDPSGAPTSAPADVPAAAPTAPAAGAQSPGAFGATRGSGLARGKRPAPVSASAAAPSPAGYKPTALEVITPTREYKNPFTGETVVNAPPANEPAPQAARPEPVERAPTTEAAAPAATPVATEPAAPVEKADLSAVGSAKAELNILPPEAPKRPVVGWEAPRPAGSGEQPRRDDRERGGFRNDRREERKFEPREPRRDDRKFEPRTNQPYQPREDRGPRPERQEQPAAEKKSGGFIGWLKGLFGGKKSEEPTATGGTNDRRDGDQGHHRRHRGGRGRGGYRGDDRGPRDGQPRPDGGQPHQGGGEQRHGEHRGDGDQGGFRRRRRRGGRGRFRGEGGDRGDRGGRDPRPEGQQGGGAI